MLKIERAVLRYNDKTLEIPAGKKAFAEELYVDFSIEKINEHQQRIKLDIHPKTTVKIQHLAIELYHPYGAKERIFCNGFQSWTESREFGTQEKIAPVRSFAKSRIGRFGDYDFYNYPNREGHLHGWSYTYIRRGGQVVLLGSLSEFTGYTLFRHDVSGHQLCIEKDCAGLELSHSYPALDIFMGEGEEAQQFSDYFGMMEIDKPKVPSIVGWTSWYHYYTKISESIILENLNAFAEKQTPIDLFQIDDGYQTHIGDWLTTKPTFPNGMAGIAKQIHDKNYKAGLWLAPFICEKQSKIFRDHPDWILKDEAGQAVRAGYNPLWSGWFYVLDFYHQEVQKYLTSVFFTVLDKWNYDLVKLDFLYAVALAPPKNKTRGQVMHEALRFLRNLVGNKLILGCGVPLGSAYGLVDYCRIGADVHTSWEHKLLKWLRGRERVSTILSLRNTLSRWQLDGRAFLNDPDVFILRAAKQKLNIRQQDTLLLINTLLGSVLFTSDYVGDYTDEQWERYNAVFKWKDSQIQRVEGRDDVYEIYFQQEENDYVALCNLTKEKRRVRKVELEGFETRIELVGQ